MNWLAHAFLSPPETEVRLGNLLADLVKGRERKAMPAGFLRGVRRHQAIDGFTDFHAMVFRSRKRISDQFGRFSGILVDIFYDHYLARDWPRYSIVELGSFTQNVYRELGSYREALPPLAREVAFRMVEDDRLASYRTVDGIRSTLQRLSARLSERAERIVDLVPATEELVRNYEALDADFAAFFPELADFVQHWKEN